MGMHTELLLKCSIKTDAPVHVHRILHKLFNNTDYTDTLILPEHPFFDCPRWQFIGRGSSYYHTPFSMSKYSEGYLFSRSDLKNYNNEIKLFIEWVTPYVDEFDGTCIGWEWYEEDVVPTLIIYRGSHE